MACSAISLSIGTIVALVAVACLAIAFGTDNWYEIRVNRTSIRRKLDGNEEATNEFEEDIRYFNRDEGLFRICFPNNKPQNAKTFLSPVLTECININYYIPDNEISDTFSETRWERLHMARAVIGLYISGLFCIFMSFFTGVAGCWKRSYRNVVATGLLEMFASLLVAAAMGLWHGVHYYDYQKLKDQMAYFSWPEVLKQPGVTEFYYGWSYLLSWIGVGLNLIASILLLCGAQCLRHEKKKEKSKYMHYLMPVYPDKRQLYGYGR
ncbi:claudin domain-containing protein 1-like isoform X2 [Tachypleus tridentatus]|uniref:claudin domain-containing protein 1-like isoform X2 n=1 Tax=Tachypleus tridentatus TaxID=6853 RepID=UPI003FD55865